MKTVIAFIFFYIFACELLMVNDEFVLFVIAFITQTIITISFTPMIINLAEETAYFINQTFSQNLNLTHSGLTTGFSNSINFFEKILGISISIQNVSTNSTSLVSNNELKTNILSLSGHESV